MTTEQVKLKPCPMGCAGDVIGGEHEGASVYCKVCWLRAVSPEAWNTRIDPPSPDAGERREAIARLLWDRIRERLRGHRGRRIMPAWADALPEERELYLSDADAILALSPAPDADTVMVPNIDMLNAGYRALVEQGVDVEQIELAPVYAALLAASQVKPDPLPAIPEGMKPWHGGDSAPEDWDGGPVLGEDGAFYDPPVEWCKPSGGPDVAAYRPVVHGHVNPIVAAYTPRPLPSPELGEVQ